MNGFNESTAACTRLQYRIILMYPSGKHNQPVSNIGRSFKKLVILLQVAPFTFFQNGEYTFRIKRECKSLYLTSLP